MSQQPAGKMSAATLAAEALEPAAGMLEGRQRKLESMIRDPRSPVNVESLLVRGGRARGERSAGEQRERCPRLGRAGGNGKEGKGSRVLKVLSWGRTGDRLHAPGRATGSGEATGAALAPRTAERGDAHGAASGERALPD